MPIYAARHAGEIPTGEDEELTQEWALQPNRVRWLIHFLSEPQRIVEYVAANCTTATLGGPNREGWREQQHFGFFTGTVVPSSHRPVQAITQRDLYFMQRSLLHAEGG